MCGRTAACAGDPKLRAAHRCSLPDFDRANWSERPGQQAYYLADELVGIANVQGLDLGFDLEVDGCPWGWTLSRFVTELWSYVGTRGSASPSRAPSMRLQRRMMRDDEEPRELFELVRLAEGYEDGAWAYFRGRCSD